MSFPPKPSSAPDNLHAPWRLSYMDMLSKADRDAAPTDGPPEKAACFLREYWLHPERDEQNHVVVRTGTPETGRGGLIMLNAYPYANGHLLVCLGESRMRLMEYTQEQRVELWSLVDLAVALCERALEPQGVNIGVNQGEAAGAGVPEHLHAHVVPRWSGDVNFITAVGAVRVIPSALGDMYRRYAEAWGAMKPTGRADTPER
jgi:ATP adenylyltransferase